MPLSNICYTSIIQAGWCEIILQHHRSNRNINNRKYFRIYEHLKLNIVFRNVSVHEFSSQIKIQRRFLKS